MSDWQPVRIAPFDGKAHADTWGYGTIEEALEGRRLAAGKIVRVCRYPKFRERPCGAEHEFLVHPDDAEKIFGHRNASLCEHQILTD